MRFIIWKTPSIPTNKYPIYWVFLPRRIFTSFSKNSLIFPPTYTENFTKKHEFAKNDITALYSFDDCVPVGIWEGKCVVDFKEIYEYLRFLDVEDDVDTDE